MKTIQSKRFGIVRQDVYSSLKILIDFVGGTLMTVLIDYLVQMLAKTELGSWQWLIFAICLFLAKLLRKYVETNQYTIEGE
jgi:F0F1-type ATP synthase assembly protein I